MTRTIASHVVADVCSIYLRRPDDILELYSTEGLNREAVHRTRLGIGEGWSVRWRKTAGRSLPTTRPTIRILPIVPKPGKTRCRLSLACRSSGPARPSGVLVVQNRIARRYSDEEVEAVQAVAALLAEIAASGELLSQEETAVVGEMLHRPEHAKGSAIVAGIASGRAVFLQPPAPKHKVFATDVAVEAARLEQGLTSLRASVDAMLRTMRALPMSRAMSWRLIAFLRTIAAGRIGCERRSFPV